MLRFLVLITALALAWNCAPQTYNPGDPAGDAFVTHQVLRCIVDSASCANANASSTTPTNDTTTALQCPAQYVKVPFNSAVGTAADFCVAKYEMKCAGDPLGTSCAGPAISQAANEPWVNISQATAKTECSNLGARYHLITNEEWMTVARNIEVVAANWSTGTVNVGTLSRGHSDNVPAARLAADVDAKNCFGTGQGVADVCSTFDNQIRTHALSNSSVIWDFAGNAHDWIDLDIVTGRANSGAGGWIEFTTPVVPTGAMPANTFFPFNTSLNSSNGIGRYRPGTDGSGGGAIRGASKADTISAGIYALEMDLAATTVSANVGFRCAYQ